MRVLAIGAGGVGTSAALIAARRDFFEAWVVSDYDVARANAVVERLGDDRFVAAQVDASSAEAVADLCRAHSITHVLNVIDPRFVMPVFEGAFQSGADYLDTAMSLSRPHPSRPYTAEAVNRGD
jgi:saccharopine dehydrogenase-like NADP-dependent oxidoreductase